MAVFCVRRRTRWNQRNQSSNQVCLLNPINSLWPRDVICIQRSGQISDLFNTSSKFIFYPGYKNWLNQIWPRGKNGQVSFPGFKKVGWVILLHRHVAIYDDVIKWTHCPVPGEFPAQRPVTRSFNVFFDLRLNKRLSKQSWGWWFETLPYPLWRHCNEVSLGDICYYNKRRNPGPLDSDPTHIPTPIGVHFHGSSGHALASWVPSSGGIFPSTCNDLLVWPFWTILQNLKFLPQLREKISEFHHEAASADWHRWISMMTSSMETFSALLTYSLWMESIDHRRIPLTNARDAELRCFLWSSPEQTVVQKLRRRWLVTPSRSLWRHCNVPVKFCDAEWGIVYIMIYVT